MPPPSPAPGARSSPAPDEPPYDGYTAPMTEHPDQDRIDSRSELLPEEENAGSDDRHDQAEAILEESDERTEHPEETRHESHQTPG